MLCAEHYAQYSIPVWGYCFIRRRGTPRPDDWIKQRYFPYTFFISKLEVSMRDKKHLIFFMENSCMNSEQVFSPQGNPFPNQQIIINQSEKRGNGLGTTGFVLALLGLVFCWVPVLNWILWILGLVFSAIGVFRAPRGLAITGLVLSFIGVILLIAFAAAFVAAFA